MEKAISMLASLSPICTGLPKPLLEPSLTYRSVIGPRRRTWGPLRNSAILIDRKAVNFWPAVASVNEVQSTTRSKAPNFIFRDQDADGVNNVLTMSLNY